MIERVAFFGSACSFGDRVLSQLIGHDIQVVAQIVPGNHDDSLPFRRAGERTVASSTVRLSAGPPETQTNTITRIPVVQVNHHRHDATLRMVEDLSGDVAVVCCYPRRIPLSLVQAGSDQAVNVHPSLLPRYRGPVPLFWVYRHGETQTGVTVHRVASELDAGEILRQQALDLPVGTPGDRAWLQAADVGGELLVDTLASLGNGSATGESQDQREATYYSRPEPRDLTIDPTRWEAWHVYHFCRGVIPHGYRPILVQGKLGRQILDAKDFTGGDGRTRADHPGYEWITCLDGKVQLRLGPVIF